MNERHDLETIFLKSLEFESTSLREAYLAEACGIDPDLRQEVDRLIQSHEAAGSFLEQDTPQLQPTEMLCAVAQNESVLHAVKEMIGHSPVVSLRDDEQVEPAQRLSSAQIPVNNGHHRYQLQGEIARGGMGAILKGRDTDLGRDLAVKVLLDSHKDNPDVIQRFVEEAQIGGQLQHPGIAPVYELGQFEDRRPFFTMKLVKGKTLAALLQSRQSNDDDRPRFIGIFEQVCQTMAYAHSKGVIHRDLKPANIMVGAFGEVQVMDWGLAKVLAAGGIADEQRASHAQSFSIIETLRSSGDDTPLGAGSQTQMGSVMGTPAYMPPEQALGEVDQLNERSDVFGLGAILCEILTGKPPYVGDDSVQVFRMASRAKLDDCLNRLNDCTADLELVTLTKNCLAPEPIDRPPDADALSNRVTRYLEGVENRLKETEIERAKQTTRAEEERKRRRISLALATAVILLISAIGGGGYWIQTQNAEAAEQRTEAAEQLAVKEGENARREKEAKEQLAQTLYVSQIALAHSQRNAGQLGVALKTLDAIRDDLNAEDRLGFEWYFMRRECGVAAVESNIEVAESWHQYLGPSPDTFAEQFAYYRAVSADNRRIGLVAPQQDDETSKLLVWNNRNGEEILSRSIPFQQITYNEGVTFSHDGRHLALVAHQDGGTEVQIWDTEQGQIEQTVRVNEQERTWIDIHVSFIPKQNSIAVVVVQIDETEEERSLAPSNSVLTIWDLASGEQKVEKRLAESYGRANVICSQDGTRLAVFVPPARVVGPPSDRPDTPDESDVMTVQILDATDGSEVQSLVGDPNFYGDSLAFSPNGQRLAIAVNSTNALEFSLLWVWDTVTGKRTICRPLYDMGYNRPVQFSHDGRLIAVDNHDVQVFDADSGAQEFEFYNDYGSRLRFQLHAEAMEVFALDDGNRYVWKMPPPAVGKRAHYHEFSENSDRMVYRRMKPPGMREIVVATGEGEKVMSLEAPKHDDEFAPTPQMKLNHDGTVLVGYINTDAEYDGNSTPVCVWDVDSGEKQRTLCELAEHELLIQLAMPRSGSLVAGLISSEIAGEPVSYEVRIWDYVTGGQQEISLGDAVHSIAMSSDGTVIAISMETANRGTDDSSDDGPEGRLAFYNTKDLKLSDTITTSRLLNSITFSPDDETIAGCAYNHEKIELWDHRQKKRKLSIDDHKYSHGHVFFSPDGRRIAAVRWNRLLMWDTMNGQVCLDEKVGPAQIEGMIGFSVEGNRLLVPTMAGLRIVDARPIDPSEIASHRKFADLP